MINMLLAAVFTCVKHLAEMSSAFQGKIWATCALRYKFCGSGPIEACIPHRG